MQPPETFIENPALRVNLSPDHVAVDGCVPARSVLADLETVLSIRNPSADFVADQELEAIKRLVSSNVCVSPHVLTWREGWRLTAAAAHAIIECSPLGRSMFEELERKGAFEAIYDKPHSVHIMARLLAIFCLSSKGADDLSALPAAAVHRFFDFFREDGDNRFSPVEWRDNNYIFQCLRELGLAFASFYGDKRFLKRAGQKRMTSGGKATYAGTIASFEEDWLPLRTLIPIYAEETDTAEYMVARTVRHLRDWLRSEFPGCSLTEMLSGAAPRTKFSKYLRDLKDRLVDVDITMMNCAHDFTDYLLKELGIKKRRVDWRLVTKNEIKAAQNDVKKDNPRKDKSKNKFPALPVRFLPILNDILDEGESGFPGKCGFFHEIVFVNGKRFKKYCPVLIKLIRARTRLPLRTAGPRRLDSGEGDLTRYDPETGWFVENTSPHAGYWVKNIAGKDGQRPRGYAVPFEGTKSRFVGINLNSNKTGTVRPIRFEVKELLCDLAEVAAWVEQYVPIDGPISAKDYVDEEKRLKGSSLESLPSIFPLFRLPIYARGRRGIAPPTARRLSLAWLVLMKEVERRWNEGNPTRQVTLVNYDAKGSPSSAVYVPHSLRSRGITDFAEIYGIEFVSEEMAQHSSMGMTYAYLDPDPEQVNLFYQSPQLEKQTAAQQNTIGAARGWRFEEAQKYVTYISEDGLRETMLPAHKQCLLNVGIGVCPLDGAGCSHGGPRQEDGSHHEVPGGTRNCVLCRYFWSGPAWLNELALFEESLRVKIEDNEKDQKDVLLEVNRIKNGKFAVLAQDATVDAFTDARQAELLRLQDEAEILDQTRIATSIHINSARKIMDDESFDQSLHPGLALVVNDAEATRSVLFDSGVERRGWLSLFSRVHPILRNERTEAKNREMIQQFKFDLGSRPRQFVSPLTEQEKRYAHDRAVHFSLMRLNAMEFERIDSGQANAADFNVAAELNDLLTAKFDIPIDLRQPLLAQASA